MNLYDKLIDDIFSKLPPKADKIWKYDFSHEAKPGEKNAIIFRNETAFELGSAGKSSVCSVLFTSAEDFNDEVLLFGKDINETDTDTSFAHFVIVSLNEQDEFKFEQLKEIEFSVYRIYPEGYNVRISPVGGKETVRVSKNAKESGLSFENIGCSYIREFKKNPLVKSVKVIFATLDSIDFKALSITAKKANAVTKTLASDFENFDVGCESCSMKPLCDEIEGFRELHFNKKKLSKGEEK